MNETSIIFFPNYSHPPHPPPPPQKKKNCKMCTFWFISRILPQILSQSYLAAVSISWSFFHALRFTPIRFSACSNPVSKSIQTTSSFIIYKILKMTLTGVEFKFLNYQLNHNGTFPPKKIIFESKYIFYGPTTNLMKMLKNPLAYIKILKSDN